MQACWLSHNFSSLRKLCSFILKVRTSECAISSRHRVVEGISKSSKLATPLFVRHWRLSLADDAVACSPPALSLLSLGWGAESPQPVDAQAPGSRALYTGGGAEGTPAGGADQIGNTQRTGGTSCVAGFCALARRVALSPPDIG